MSIYAVLLVNTLFPQYILSLKGVTYPPLFDFDNIPTLTNLPIFKDITFQSTSDLLNNKTNFNTNPEDKLLLDHLDEELSQLSNLNQNISPLSNETKSDINWFPKTILTNDSPPEEITLDNDNDKEIQYFEARTPELVPLPNAECSNLFYTHKHFIGKLTSLLKNVETQKNYFGPLNITPKPKQTLKNKPNFIFLRDFLINKKMCNLFITITI